LPTERSITRNSRITASIVRGSIAESKLPHAYTGATSTEFSIGMKQALRKAGLS
jgi:hypothetical protein